MKLFSSRIVATALAVGQVSASVIGRKPAQLVKKYEAEPLQDIVTWDAHSLFVRGERIMFYSGEFHPFRLPVPGLWLDVFQKIRAMGYNGVSFYSMWSLLEPKPGHFAAEGVFAFEPFFEAAKKAGIYLLARPGPYINAEVSGGGFPGWLQRVPGHLRTSDAAYLNATDNYASHMGKIIASAQITNGGPIILVQPENEYTYATGVPFPDNNYMSYVEKQLRDAGIVVPFINNDASASGNFAPGKPAAVDIYGHDGYPLGFNCANPDNWPDSAMLDYLGKTHLEQSPSTPYSIVEYQGGSFDPWGGLGFEKCAALLNANFERVFWKNVYSFEVTILNIYMTYGGTNWGNLGHPGGYSSYDYGAVIRENRGVDREKYSEAKLQANFLQVSPAYLNATFKSLTKDLTSSQELVITPLMAEKTGFYVLRHDKYNVWDSTSYKANLPTSLGKTTVPQLGGELSLSGRDSKILVTDYAVGAYNLLYSSAEVFSWSKDSLKTTLIVYTGPNETNELAFTGLKSSDYRVPQGVILQTNDGTTIINWASSSRPKIVNLSGLSIHLVDRYAAYNYWHLDLTSNDPNGARRSIIAKADYLLRAATLTGGGLAITGDVNATTTLEIFSGAPANLQKLTFNGRDLTFKQSRLGVVTAEIAYEPPQISVPDLKNAKWHYIDSLPEISPKYDDSMWTNADHKVDSDASNQIKTPFSLSGSEYGYHSGSLLYRGHFTALGTEKVITLSTIGGTAYGMSAWLGSTFLGSHVGNASASQSMDPFFLPATLAEKKGSKQVLTVLIDHMGLEEDYDPGVNQMKTPRGILDFALDGHPDKTDVTWKLTGNLGGEDYIDRTRGPLNEGALWAERNGFHQPGAPVNSQGWKPVVGGPAQGLKGAGVGLFTTTFDLSFPRGYDYPISFVFTNSVGKGAAFRAQLFVNGWQFGEYVNNIGPQTEFPVPEGILNLRGQNTVAVTLWALEAGGASLDVFEMRVGRAVEWGYEEVGMVESPRWEARVGAY